ncbi:MAG: VWA domain-containing protein [Firmicutes bacterium]|nr:VWA domain-containing protein [Bacillota bacterium]
MKRTRHIALLALTACLLAVIVSSFAGAQTTLAGEKTYIELILDSSISMSAFVEGWKSRMDVAKAVMEQLIRDLPDDPNLMVALRIYGAELRPNLTPCEDTVLVQPFAPVAKARRNMIDQVKSMKARGMTPIALSLEQAAKDFADKAARNIIVLITDGEESCGGDPCAVSAKLQADGFVMKPYVVGFALKPQEVEKVRCIGEYYTASDTASLRQALATIMARAVAPAQIEVQAWAGPTNVTRQAEIEIVKSTGEVVQSTRTAQDPPVVRAQVDEGQYIVRGRLLVGSQILTAQAAGIIAKPGQTSVVRLDFGPLDGRVRVTARASGQDVSDRVDIRVLEAGRTVAAGWAGIPPTATLPAGDYTIVVTHRQYPELTRTATATVQTGRDTYVDVDLGELPAALEVAVTYRGAVISNLCQLSVLAPGQATQVIRNTADGRVFRWTSTPGVYDLNVMYRDAVTAEKAVRGVQLAGGRTTSITVNLDDLLGALRVRVVAGGRDVTSDSKVVAAGRDGKIELPLAGGMRQALVTPGVYAVSAIYRDTESDMHEAYVRPGENTDLTIEVKLPGRIAIIPTVEGKPMRPDRLRAWAYLDGASVGSTVAQSDRVEIVVPEGKYNVVGEISEPFAQRRESPGVEVRPGETVQIKMNFDPAGLLRVKLISDGKPFTEAGVAMYFDGGDDWNWMDEASRGVWEMKVPEGTHDIVIHPRVSGMNEKRVTGIEVPGGSTVERTITLGGTGLLRIKLVSDGKPFTEAGAAVYFDGGDDWNWMDEVSRGVWETKVPEGTHDIVIHPRVSGMNEKRVTGIEVPGGSTVERTITLGGTGLLRIKLVSDGKPFTEAGAAVYFDGGDDWNWMDEVSRGVWEMKVPEGMHDIVIHPRVSGMNEKRVTGIEVPGGSTVERTITLGGTGLLRIKLVSDGKPFTEAEVAVHFEGGDDWNWMDGVTRGVWEMKVPEGTHDIVIHPRVSGMNETRVTGIEVPGGSTVEKTITIGSLGLLRVRLIADGKPFNKARIEVYDDYDDYVTDLTRVVGGTFEARLPGGMYRIVVEPDSDSYDVEFIDDIELEDGRTVELSVTLREF